MGRTKPIVSADYVVGITDGEGCFYVNLGKYPTYASGWRVQLHFHLKLQAKDVLLLKKIRNTLQCGNVYFQHETRKNHTQCYRYTERIIPFFNKHPLQTASKLNSFSSFCKIAKLVEKKRHLTNEGIDAIKVLKAQMNQRTAGLA